MEGFDPLHKSSRFPTEHQVRRGYHVHRVKELIPNIVYIPTTVRWIIGRLPRPMPHITLHISHNANSNATSPLPCFGRSFCKFGLASVSPFGPRELGRQGAVFRITLYKISVSRAMCTCLMHQPITMIVGSLVPDIHNSPPMPIVRLTIMAVQLSFI